MRLRAALREAWSRVWKWASGWATLGPHFVIGGPDRPYLKRWYLVPRNPWCNVYLHQFLRDDDDRAMHDHPWRSCSLVLRGGYYELTPGPGPGPSPRRWYGPGSFVRRSAEHTHRVELLLVEGRGPADPPRPLPCWTLFVTGPVAREWGFHCPHRWVHWKEFLGRESKGRESKGRESKGRESKGRESKGCEERGA